jgi:hypothetical protein
MIERLFEQLDCRSSNQILLDIHCKFITLIYKFVNEWGNFYMIGDDCTDCTRSSHISLQIRLKHIWCLMFVPCIIERSRKKQHNAQICTTALFHMLAPTCFGSSLPSSGSFWIRLSYVKNTDWYGGLSYNVVKWPVCRSV